MSGTWWTRFTITALILAWGIYMLLPSFLGESAQAVLARQAATVQGTVGEDVTLADEAEVELPWWSSWLPAARINLGLDLQGGIDMTLEIGVDEAVISSVQRDIRPLREAAEKEGLKLGEVRRTPGKAEILIRGPDGGTLEMNELQLFMQKQYKNYEYDNTRTLDGYEFHAFALTEAAADYTRQRTIEQALEKVRSRVDETGVKEPLVVLKGGNRINVQLPGVEKIEEATQIIGTTALLEFMMVDEEVKQSAIDRAVVDAEAKAPPDIWAKDQALSDWMVRNGLIPSTDRLLWEYKEVAGQKVRDVPYVLHDEVVLTGDDINDANVQMNQYNEPYVALEFKPRGGKVFCDITTENVGRRFGIVLDKKVSSAPNIRERICGGRASIEMGVQDYQQALSEASILSRVLRTGALPAPVTIGNVNVVGSQLGEDAILAGKEATAVGSVLVVLFMIVYYRKSGTVACVALAANIMLVMALLAAAGATLTLPGIAGIALTVGMAVDCNIIIYERIREELRLGKTARAAVDSGFSLALWAVLDANITTFIAGVVLYSYGSGPIKGFAVTLMIGIITTLFTGIFVSRMLMDLLTRRTSARLSI